MKNLLLSCAVVGLVAYLGGWYPARSARITAEQKLIELTSRLQESEQSLAIARFRNRAGLLWDQVERDDYGAAGEVASKLFTELRTFTNALPAGDLQQGLERSLGNRDAITATLAKADPSARGMIRDLFRKFPER